MSFDVSLTKFFTTDVNATHFRRLATTRWTRSRRRRSLDGRRRARARRGAFSATAGFRAGRPRSARFFARCARHVQECQLRSGDRDGWRGTTLDGADAEVLRGLLGRFSDQAAALVDRLLPGYRGSGRARGAPVSALPKSQAAPAPGARTTRACTSTAFPRRPSGGRRILRLFTNVNPDGPAAVVAHRRRVRGGRAPLRRRAADADARHGALLCARSASRSRARSAVRRADAAAARPDEGRRRLSDRRRRRARSIFRRDRRWLAFTDEVSHAAMAGQYQLEQTFLLPVSAMRTSSGRRSGFSSG